LRQFINKTQKTQPIQKNQKITQTAIKKMSLTKFPKIFTLKLKIKKKLENLQKMAVEMTKNLHAKILMGSSRLKIK